MRSSAFGDAPDPAAISGELRVDVHPADVVSSVGERVKTLSAAVNASFALFDVESGLSPFGQLQ
jgi:hypothetical protein